MIIRYSDLIGFLVPFSMLMYALRGNVGALAIATLIFVLILCSKGRIKNEKMKLDTWWVFFFLIFALFGMIFRANNAVVLQSSKMELYLVIGYVALPLVFICNRVHEYKQTLFLWLKGFAFFEAFGVLLQRIMPGVFYQILPYVLLNPGGMTANEIRNRAALGYFTGFTKEVSFTALFLIIGIAIFFDEITQERVVYSKSQRTRKIISILFLFIMLFMTGKRAQPIMCIASCVWVLYASERGNLKLLKYIIIALMVVGGLAISLPLWSGLPAVNRLIELYSGYKSGESIIGLTSGRTVIYEEALKLWRTNPWFGIGWGNFKRAVPDTAWYSGFDVHSCYLQVLCECGIIGATCFYSLAVVTVRFAYRMLVKLRTRKDKEPGVVFAALYVFFFFMYCITGANMYEYSYYVLLIISIMLLGNYSIYDNSN